MYRRMIYVVSLLAVLSMTGRVSADLVAHWPLDDGSGTVAADVPAMEAMAHSTEIRNG